MSNTLDRIGQTCRTILFEEFSDQSDEATPSLYNIINSAGDKTFGRDKFYREIEDVLMVHSFKEFVQKFAPTVYEYAVFVGGYPVFYYTTDKKAAEYGVPVDIVDHSFFEMLVEMYAQRGASGKSHLDFKEDKIKDIMTPKAQMEEAYDVRRKLRKLAIDLAKAEEEGQDELPYIEDLISCRLEISKKYHDARLGMLPLAIEDAKVKIENISKNIELLESSDNGVAPVLKLGQLVFNPDGTMGVKEISVDAGKDGVKADQPALEANSVGNVLALVEKDVNNCKSLDEFSKKLVISTYAPPEIVNNTLPLDLPALKKELQKQEKQIQDYEIVYRQAQEAFIAQIIKIVQKMLGVYVFFDHATIKGADAGKFKPGLLVANCKPAKLLKQKMKDKFITVMRQIGHELEGKKTWLAILPDVVGENMEDKNRRTGNRNLTKIFDRPIDEIKEVMNKSSSSEDTALTLQSARNFLKIMDQEGGILTFFNFMPDENNTFAGINASEIEKMEATLKDMDNPHAVLAYPNFTIMRTSKIELYEDGERLLIPNIYVSAAYVAAGLVAASQQYDLLENRLGSSRLIPGSVCTRVDLEDEDLCYVLQTKFNRELAYTWPDDINAAIHKHRFGFAFCADPKVDKDNRKFQHTYVLQASSMHKDGNKYLPLYYTMTQDFVNNYLRYMGKELSEDNINSFINNDVKEWKKDAEREKYKNKINLVLRQGEEITRTGEGDETTLEIALQDGKVKIKPNIKTKKAGENK